MIGEDIHNFAKDLWPINRSITGYGLRETLNQIKNHLPEMKIKSIPSGTKVFDWEVPNEWNVRKAYIVTPSGQKICDFSKNNLHLLGYSIPFEGHLPLEKLKKHLFYLPEQPNAIPYITSYYNEKWGFCLSKDQYDSLSEGTYQVLIDCDFSKGNLNYGELIIPGLKEEEIFLSSYICHPSMANNELSGPCVLTFLSKWISKLKNRRFTYRVIFVPETIGSISYLSKNHKKMKEKVIAGYNLSCMGDERSFSFLPSRKGDSLSDKVARHILKWTDPNFKSYTWLDRGSDERQYCSPGIDLPIASILRTKYGEYPEYHTSLDNLIDVVTPKGLNGGYLAVRNAIELIENNKIYQVNVLCEPHMSKYDLYPTLSTKNRNKEVKLMMDFISFCDGKSTLLDIVEELNIPCWEIYNLVDKLIVKKIISIS